MKIYEDVKSTKSKALMCHRLALSDIICRRIMTCKTTKEAKIKSLIEMKQLKIVKLLALKQEFEMLRMKARDIVKEYPAKLVEIVNKITMLN